jgi:hypothetical protein
MPETTINGYSNGNGMHNGYELENGSNFLFTSESVGEGHPGESEITLNYYEIQFEKKCVRKPTSS